MLWFSGGEGVEGILSVLAREAATGKGASAAAPVKVVGILPTDTHEGIPEPELVEARGAPWRSRLHDGNW
jgi:hypothetical protein